MINDGKVSLNRKTKAVHLKKNIYCVNRLDQFKFTYEIDKKRTKGWIRSFWHFVDCPIVTNYMLYKLKELPPLSLKEFGQKV